MPLSSSIISSSDYGRTVEQENMSSISTVQQNVAKFGGEVINETANGRGNTVANTPKKVLQEVSQDVNEGFTDGIADGFFGGVSNHDKQK